jgi:hypothetical protein
MTSENSAPDWGSIVREKLASLRHDVAEIDEVSAELAAHLEDLYEKYREEDLPQSSAVARVLNEVSDWRSLSRRIRRAKQKEDEMNQRTKAVWIPGLISMTVGSGVLAVLQIEGVRPHIVWMRSGLAVLFYIPWLIAQPAFGAIGAYISRRNGGTLGERLAAGLFPVVATLATFGVMLCVAIVGSLFANGHGVTLAGLMNYIALWVVVPGFALAIGALPFLRNARPRESH